MITGLDVLARPNASIPVATFDGRHLPLPDAGVDVVMFVDVLHHAEEPFELLAEARRVARNGILIKDHLCETRSNARILGLMDWVGNFGHGVALPYNYWSSDEWKTARDRLGLQAVETRKDLGLYPAVVRPLFENGLHFVSYLSSRDASARA
jgi:SAM-dependent methyltransferase